MTLNDELAAFYQQSGFGDEIGKRSLTVPVYTGCLLVPLPNIETRRRFLKYHDLHHLITGYGVGRIGEGEIFGAMAALTHADRSATVRAKTHCSVVKVPKEQFTELIRSNPATIHSLLVDMANSIVNLNEQLVGLSAGLQRD